MLFLCLLLIGLWFALELESVQNWLINKYTNKLSEELDTKVEIKHVSFSLFNMVSLDSVLIEDKRGDTLLFAGRLDARMRSGLMGLVRQDIDVESIDIHDTQFRHYRDSSLLETNMGFLLDHFSKNKTEPDTSSTKEKVPFLLNIERFGLHNIKVVKIDKTKGEYIDVELGHGEITGLDFDQDKNHLSMGQLFLDDFHFHFDKKEKIRKEEEAKPVEIKKEKVEKDTSYVMFTASANKVIGKNGHFYFDDHRKEFIRPKFERTMDFTDLDVSEIQVEIDSFWFREDLLFRGELKHASAKEQCGLVLESGKAKEVEVSRKGLHLYGMELKTPTSILGDTLEMKYRKMGYIAFEEDFVNEVYLSGKFKEGSKISLEDIFTFAPELESNNFFRQSRKEVLEIEGIVKGKINSLKTKGFTLKIGDDFIMKGDFNSKNLAVRGEEFMNLKLTDLRTSVPTLRALIPGFSPPQQFDKLGALEFQGTYYGFFTDFTAIGKLNTALGKVESDINLKGDKNDARYSGSLSLIDFDLGTWSDNKDLSLVNFSAKVNNGTGLTLETINADLDAKVESLTFKNYKYQFLNIGGKFDKKRFEGEMDIKDDNIDLSFNGLVDFNERIPRFNFVAGVQKILFHNLNLSKTPLEFKGKLDFDFQGLKIEELDGTASAREVEFKVDTLMLELDSIYAYSLQETETTRKVGIQSDVLNGELIGSFQLIEIPDALMDYLNRIFPKFSKRLKIPKPKKDFSKNKYFTFDFSVPNSKNFMKLVSPKFDTLFNATLSGYFDNKIDTLFVDFAFDKGKYDIVELGDVVTTGKFGSLQKTFDIGTYRTIINDSLTFTNIALYNSLDNDTVNFELIATDFTEYLDDVNLEGSLTLEENESYKISFNSSDLVLYNQKWEILDDNFIKFGKDYVETKNFILNNQDFIQQQVELNSIGKKGLSLKLNDFDLGLLNKHIKTEMINIRGFVDLKVEMGDIFKQVGIRGDVRMDSLFINDDLYGALDLNVWADDINTRINTDLRIINGEQKIISTGYYRPPYVKRNKNYFDQNIEIRNYPLSIGEYFIGEHISNTVGNINADLKLKGNPSDPQLSGPVRILDGATTVNYLQTRLSVFNDTINVKPDEFNFDGLTIYDREGNAGNATGGILNDKFRKFALDIKIESPNFVAMETTEEDNPLFYGKGIGDIKAEFTGDFKNTNIDVLATSGVGTKIFLPLKDQKEESDLSFIIFNSNSSAEDTSDLYDQFIPDELKGLDLTLDLNITTDAEIQMIFDEKAGDILRGIGTGQIKIEVSKDGEFNMFGDYVVEEGSYLFTLLNVVNKPFDIKKGGTISFTGDPLEAELNIEASYAKLSTTPYNFILEYLSTDEEKAAAQQTTPIDLTMKLQGILSQPDIEFDIGFPSLRGRMKNFTDSKLRIVREDENELNRQVLGLIAFGSFFPSDMAYSNSGLIDGGINTLSEMLSNQLSIYVSELLSEVITDVDFDINYRYYELSDLDELNPESFKTGSELEIRLKKGLFNNRLTINAGSNFDVDGGNNGAFLAGDLLIEYLLTPDGRFKLRFYQESDQTITGDRRNQTGVGITYRREFDNWKDFLKRDKKNKKKIHEDFDEFKQKAQETFEKSKEEDLL